MNQTLTEEVKEKMGPVPIFCNLVIWTQRRVW